MFDSIPRSVNIAKTTFGVMKQDKELFLFPLLASFFSLMLLVIMVVPFIAAGFLDMMLTQMNMSSVGTIIFFVLLFILYFSTTAIATFFNVCVVYTAKKRFEGGDSKFFEAISFAFSKIHLILMWAAVSATVGIILQLLDSGARQMKGIGRLVAQIIVSLIGFAWSIMTIFVVPSMVFNGTGPIAAIKESSQVISKTWGESLVRHYGLGLVQLIITIFFVLPFLILAIIAFILGQPVIGAILFVLFLGLLILISVLFSAANNVFNTALFWYATKGQVPGYFEPDVMANAFRQKRGMF